MLTLEQLNDEREIRELANVFANLADEKNAKAQGELFLPDGMLEFQMGIEGEIQNIAGREQLVEAFRNTLAAFRSVYHINGQHVIDLYGDMATATAYCQASLVTEHDGREMMTVNDVRYSDVYRKMDGRWYIEKRRTTFLISDTHELRKEM